MQNGLTNDGNAQNFCAALWGEGFADLFICLWHLSAGPKNEPFFFGGGRGGGGASPASMADIDADDAGDENVWNMEWK